MTDLDPFASATLLRAALAARRVSALELTELYIKRIERHDGSLNAVVVRDFARARERARLADPALAGARSPGAGRGRSWACRSR
jgi:amidase